MLYDPIGTLSTLPELSVVIQSSGLFIFTWLWSGSTQYTTAASISTWTNMTAFCAAATPSSPMLNTCGHSEMHATAAAANRTWGNVRGLSRCSSDGLVASITAAVQCLHKRAAAMPDNHVGR